LLSYAMSIQGGTTTGKSAPAKTNVCLPTFDDDDMESGQMTNRGVHVINVNLFFLHVSRSPRRWGGALQIGYRSTDGRCGGGEFGVRRVCWCV
jgi:hypothetical protein